MQMILGNGLADASDRQTSPIINPASGETVDTVPEATVEDVQRAIAVAVEAQIAVRDNPDDLPALDDRHP